MVPPGIRTFRRSFADTRTSSRSSSTWLGLDFRTPSNTCFATGTRSGWATHVPSNPSFASRTLSSRTLARAISFASGSFRLGMNAAMPPIACLHEEIRVRPHEGDGHRHPGPIRQDEFLPGSEFLDDAERVVPPACVEARGMVSQLIQDLLHLEGRGDRLDEHGGLHRAHRNPDCLLSEPEHVVPETGLQMAFHLGQIEVRTGPTRSKLLRIVEEIESEVQEASRNRRAVDEYMLLREVPTSGANQERRDLPVQAVDFSFGTLELQGPPHRIEEIQLPLDEVAPGRRVCVFEVRHEHPGARVQGIDHHLPIGRPGDFDSAIEQVLGERPNPPRPITDVGSLGEEVEGAPLIDSSLALRATMQEVLTRPIEGSMQVREELEGFAGEECGVPTDRRGPDFDALDGWTSHAFLDATRLGSASKAIILSYSSGVTCIRL